jgi:hypothetical protein
VAADRGQLWERFYVATDRGCCDSADALSFFSLTAGGPQFIMSRYGDPPSDLLPSITEPGRDEVRYVAFHDAYTSEQPPEMAISPDAVGVIQYGGETGGTQRVVVHKIGGTHTDVRLDHIAFGVGGKESTGSWPTSFGRPAWPQPSTATGFNILLHLFAYDDPPVLLRIPVIGDSIRIERATVPRGFSLSLSSVRQPANER